MKSKDARRRHYLRYIRRRWRYINKRMTKKEAGRLLEKVFKAVVKITPTDFPIMSGLMRRRREPVDIEGELKKIYASANNFGKLQSTLYDMHDIAVERNTIRNLEIDHQVLLANRQHFIGGYKWM